MARFSVKTLAIVVLSVIQMNLSFSQNGILWKFKTINRVYSSPLVENDNLYIGSGDGYLYAINKTTGDKVWNFKTDGAVHSSPMILNNLVYFASADGNLYAIHKISGKLHWKFKSKGEKKYDLWDYYLSSPKDDGQTIYWGSGDNNLYALNSKSGELKWKFKADNIIHASPVIYNNRVFFGSFDGHFYCLDKEDGSLVWKFKTIGATYFPKGEIQKAALVKDGVVYFGSRDYNIYALDAKTGRGKWNLRQERGWIIATPTIYEDNIYFGTSDAHKFYSLNKENGKINWTSPVNMRIYGTAVAHNGTIYFGTFDGKVIGLNSSTSKKEWEFQIENSRQNYSKIYNEKGEFKTGFELYGKDFKQSEKMIHNLGSILSTPTIDKNIIYFGSSDGNIYAVKLGQNK